MALFVIDKDNRGLGEYHISSNQSTTRALNSLAFHCGILQADGDELRSIQFQFPMLIPKNHKRVIKWYGDDAKFICANLDLAYVMQMTPEQAKACIGFSTTEIR